MAEDRAAALATVQQYRAALESMEVWVARDPGAADVARTLEQIVRFEIEHRIPEEERLASRIAARGRALPSRTAIISDIHGNHAGLVAALADIDRQRCDQIVCLGDLVDGGPDNEAVIETLQQRGIPCVRGNHDEINDVELPGEMRSFLLDLPERIVEDNVLYIHTSPRKNQRKINHAVEAWNVFDDTKYRLMFVGHVHEPLIFGMRSSAFGEAAKHAFTYNQPFTLSPEDRYIVSVGAIGYGRDHVGKVRYAIYDRNADTIELRAVDGPVLALDWAAGARSAEAS
jgi:predicted phosphodiesterase